MFTSSSSLRALALTAALLGPSFYLTGCGGGSGGSNGPSMPTSPVPTARPTGAPTPTPVPTNPAGGGQLLFDDFSSPSLSTANWDNLNEFQPLQRTRFGTRPANLNEGGTSFTRLTLDSYNPTPGQSGQTFRGTEILSKQFFNVGSGLQAEARLRAPGLPSGLIFAFFLINDRFTGNPPAPSNQRKDEIDFEGITAQQDNFGSRNRLYTNVWNDWNEGLYGFDGNTAPEDTPNRNNDDLVYQPSVDPNYDYANWNVYRIRWYPDRTEFYVNGRLERIEREVKPDQAMQVRFNFWTPTPDFVPAYSGNLPGPVSTPDDADRRIYQFDVDYVRVTSLGGANSARVASPTETAGAMATSNRLYRTR